MEAAALDTIQSICHVDADRAAELLAAASGSVERAVELHLTTHGAAGRSEGEAPNPRPAAEVRLVEEPSVQSSPTKRLTQHKLDAFFSPRSKKRPRADVESSIVAVRKEDRKFGANSTMIQLKEPYNQRAKADSIEVAAAPDMSADKSLSYAMLAEAFAEITATTKRTIKTDILTKLFLVIIQSVGGIHDRTNREHDAFILTCAIDLILGKLSSSSTSSTSMDASATVLQVSGAAVSAALQAATGAARKELSSAYRSSGDMGDVAAAFFVSTRQRQFFAAATSPASLTIVQVHEQLRRIANVSAGKGSQKERHGLLVRLIQRAGDKEELRFLIRLLLGNMRLGATIKTIIVALASAVTQAHQETLETSEKIPNPSKSLEGVFNVCPRLDKINVALLTGGIPYAINHCSIEVGSPIQPMLADPVHSFEDIQTFLTAPSGRPLKARAEFKYDGVRCQAHWDGQQIKLFSRNMLENTQQFPDVVESILEAKSTDTLSFIIDAEIVGVIEDQNCSGGYRLLPFQDLSTRRGTKNRQSSDRVSVRIYVFDIMFLNGGPLLSVSLWERQQLLRQHFQETPGFAFAESTIFHGFQEQDLNDHLRHAIDQGAEGLMLKLTGDGAFQVPYESGKRSQTWKKVKKDYLGSFADTIDVVPIGAWFGNGRKAQKGFLSPVLFAIYDDEEGVFRSISRCMSFSDAMYEAMREFYFRGTPYPSGVGLEETPEIEDLPRNALIDDEAQTMEPIGTLDGRDDGRESLSGPDQFTDDRINCFPCRPPSSVFVTNESPPIWFKPLEVFEVSYADLTLSKAHAAAAGLIDDPEGRGVALRFPRFKRRRPDKTVEQATTSIDIARLFHQQAKILKNRD